MYICVLTTQAYIVENIKGKLLIRRQMSKLVDSINFLITKGLLGFLVEFLFAIAFRSERTRRLETRSKRDFMSIFHFVNHFPSIREKKKKNRSKTSGYYETPRCHSYCTRVGCL